MRKKLFYPKYSTAYCIIWEEKRRKKKELILEQEDVN